MSEEGIDMERCMQGVDDEEAWGPEITWTNCAEQMPPDDDQLMLIYRTDLLPKLVKIMANHFHHLCIANGIAGREWTEFTKEKWEALNK